jgi:murein DD-endopeptidase MepM/ murein hydrolase activator NlpD
MRLKVLAVAISVLATTISPAQAAPNYVFPIVGCDYTYAKAHHDYPATDILAKAGCRYVAATSGVIDEVNRVDSWSGKTNLGVDRGGLYVSFIGDDGVRYYASHLRTIPLSIQPGVVVKAGRFLGTVGATGSARGTKPHIHFGLSWSTPPQTWWVRRGMVWPWKYLDAWKAGKDLSPAKEVEAKRLKLGDLPPEPVNEKRK